MKKACKILFSILLLNSIIILTSFATFNSINEINTENVINDLETLNENVSNILNETNNTNIIENIILEENIVNNEPIINEINQEELNTTNSETINKIENNTTKVVLINNIWRMIVNGVVDYNYTGLGTNEYGTWYLENGNLDFGYKGTYIQGNNAHIIEGGKVVVTLPKTTTTVMQINNIWRYVENGRVNYNYTGIGTNEYGTWYIKDGRVNFDYTGNYTNSNGKTYIIENSKVKTDLNQVMQINNIWKMVVNGVVDNNYTGIGTNEYGTWYLENGNLDFGYKGTYIQGNNAHIIEGGKVVVTLPKTTTTVMQINNIWRYVENGRVNYNYTGIGTNEYGTWLIKDGTIKFDYTGNYKDKNGKIYVIEKNKLMTNVNKVIQIDNVWRMVVGGIVDFNYTGIGENDLGTWYLENGAVNFRYTGTYDKDNTSYIIEDGKIGATVPKNATTVIQVNNIWRMVENGRVNYNYTGLGTNSLGTWYIINGTIKFDYTGTYKNKDGKTYVIEKNQVMTNLRKVMQIDNIWRMVVNGIVEYNYTGIGSNELGAWYLENGRITFSYTSTYYVGNKAYIIENSKVAVIAYDNTTQVMQINKVWRMVINGRVDYSYNGIGSNSLGMWVLQNGSVNLNYTGSYQDPEGSQYNVKNGQVREVLKNVKHPGTMCVDQPTKASKHGNESMEISGWALTQETGDRIQIYLDDKYVATASRKERNDVFEVFSKNEYGGKELNPLPGFYYRLNTSGLSKGSHTLKILNLTKDGKTIIQSREVQFYIVRLAKTWGIDVSQYQGNIDWNAVKNSNVDFAILRIGYYLESSGTVVKDPYFESYYNSCRNVGIAVGGYFYSYAFNSQEATKEADACLSIIKGKSFDMPIFLDVEDNILKNGVDQNKTNVTELTNASITFCDKMNQNGYRSGVYASKNFFKNYLDTSRLEKYNIWLAHYTTSTDYTGKFDMWQYTSSGTIPGISGPVDLDWCFTRYF